MKSGNGNKYTHTDMTSWDKRHIRSNEVAVDNLSKLSRLKMLTGLVIGSHQFDISDSNIIHSNIAWMWVTQYEIDFEMS